MRVCQYVSVWVCASMRTKYMCESTSLLNPQRRRIFVARLLGFCRRVEAGQGGGHFLQRESALG